MSGEQAQVKKIFSDRPRTHLLKKYEQAVLSRLVRIIPLSCGPDMMTGIGFFGSLLVFASLVSARFFSPWFLWIAVAGFAINWFGDSLDGRLAYYRNIPRKWYGFSLDVVMDWLSTAVTGLGAFVYLTGEWGKILAFLVVVMYGWAMILSQLQFKITGTYKIDAGIMGPTEFRIVLALVIVLEFFYTGSLVYLLGIIFAILLIINTISSKELLSLADFADEEEKKSVSEVNSLDS
ncbi:MAG: hypothetical protein ABS46_06285 [Cytophagaceae bacterium SCN 52-12]|nr:MAG: hypothetical protein ABS46_06285 [Cytophagaceae bacterium SCN 52-12]